MKRQLRVDEADVCESFARIATSQKFLGVHLTPLPVCLWLVAIRRVLLS